MVGPERPSVRRVGVKQDIGAGGLIAYVFVGPAMAMFLLFLAFPVGFSLWLSFRQWNGFTPLDQAPFVGLANFAALGRDRVFQEAILNTALFAVASTAVQIAVAFILAFTLWYYRLRFATFLRALFFFPTVISMVFVGLTWQQLLDRGWAGGRPRQIVR